jgi:hypothetical protein
MQAEVNAKLDSMDRNRGALTGKAQNIAYGEGDTR